MRDQIETIKPATRYLTFAVAGEEYAIEALRVREILAYVPLTRIPRAPDFISGVMNLRGAVVPVVDLHVKLGLPPLTVTGVTCIVMVDIEGSQGPTTMGVLADEVLQVTEFAEDEIEPPPSFGTRIDLSFLRGMGDAGDHFALILDIDGVLTATEVIAAAAVAADAAAGAAPAG